MSKGAKDIPLPIEYCAFMVAIMMTRYATDFENTRVQQTVKSVAEKLNSLRFGQKPNYHVTALALHHGVFIFKKVLTSQGYTVVEMYGEDKQLQEFMSLPGGKRGYEVKFPDFETSTLPPDCTEEYLNNAILTKRDYILLRSNYIKSVFYSCSSIFMELFVDIDATVKKSGEKEETFLSPPAATEKHSFKARKTIDELSDPSIKNNGKRILEYVESGYGVVDAELYITAAYDLVVKKNRKNGTPELRSISYLEQINENRNYDEDIFENDMRVVSALRVIKKKRVVMSAEEKCQILTVFDAVKSVLTEIGIADIDHETAGAAHRLIQSHNQLCNISIRSIVRLNACRDAVLKQRGKMIQTEFEAEVWGNLMLCYFETNNNMVRTHLNLK